MNYYIKLHHEILRDPKMGKLSDTFWRRAVECFLMAGETGQDGMLPPVEDMAWILRLEPERLETELEGLSKIAITELRDGRWCVKNFTKRQEPISDAERQRMSRYRHVTVTPPSRDGHENVQEGEVEVEVDKEVEVEGEGSRGAHAPARAKHNAIIGLIKKISNLTPPVEIMDELQQVLGKSPNEARLAQCLREWVKRGYKKSNWAWALEWYKTGIPERGGNGAGAKKSAQQILAEHRSNREGKRGN